MKPYLRTLMAVASLLTAVVFSGVAATAQSGIEVRDVRVGFDGDRTRVVIDATADLDYSQFALSTGGLRYVLDFDRLVWALPDHAAHQGEGRGAGGIQRFRYAHNSETTSRLVFDLDQPLVLESSYTMEPTRQNGVYRIVLDFRPVDLDTFRSVRPSGPWSGETDVADVEVDTVARVPDLRGGRGDIAPVPERHVVVIDPGHGGRDPGTQGGAGTIEKSVVLRGALILRDILEQTGRYEVVLTRDSDDYVDHDRRIEIARAAEADIFISLHADAAGSRSVAGASVYTLSTAGDARMEQMRERMGWNIPMEIDPVDPATQDILENLVERETLTRSAAFADILIPELEAVGPILRNTHRQANFYVLLAPDVPAVLLEVGFLTNSNDERRLSSGQGLTRAMQAVGRAIDTYFDREEQALARYYSNGG